jgi:hypothetical protein
MTCTGTLLFKCSDAKTRRQSWGQEHERAIVRSARARVDGELSVVPQRRLNEPVTAVIQLGPHR